jgi:hypothetical protein
MIALTSERLAQVATHPAFKGVPYSKLLEIAALAAQEVQQAQRPLTKVLVQKILADNEAGYIYAKIQDKYADYGYFGFFAPLGRKTSATYRFKFECPGYTRLFRTLAEADQYFIDTLSRQPMAVGKGCPTCVYSGDGDSQGRFCASQRCTVPYRQLWQAHLSCNGYKPIHAEVTA